MSICCAVSCATAPSLIAWQSKLPSDFASIATVAIACFCPFGRSESSASSPLILTDSVASETTAVSVMVSPTAAELMAWLFRLAMNESTAALPLPRLTWGETTVPGAWVWMSSE